MRLKNNHRCLCLLFHYNWTSWLFGHSWSCGQNFLSVWPLR